MSFPHTQSIDTNDNLTGQNTHTISSDAEDDDEEIQVLGVLPSTRPTNTRQRQNEAVRIPQLSLSQLRPTLSSVLMNQGRRRDSEESQRRTEELQRRHLRETERQRLSQARRRALLSRRFSDDLEVTGMNFYTNPNTHINITSDANNNNNNDNNNNNNNYGNSDPINGRVPILVESDVEDSFDGGSLYNDTGAVSDTATVGSLDTASTTARQRMSLPADERSMRLAREAQTGTLRALTNQRLYGSNEPIILDDEADEEDEIQFISERAAPDIQVLSSRNTGGYELFTPRGSVFLPSPEVRTGGGNRVNLFNNVSPNRRRVLRSFIRPDNETNRQEELRRVQLQADRRAREAASGSELTNLSRNYRTRNSNASTASASHLGNSIGERTHRRPRRAAAQALTQMLMERYTGLGLFDGTSGTAVPESVFGSPAMFGDYSLLQFINNGALGGIASDDEIPSHIMNILRSRDEERENRRVSERSRVAERERAKKEKEAQIGISLTEKYTNEFLNQKDEDVCVLCGVRLKEGIPSGCSEKKWREGANAKDITEELLGDKFIAPWSGVERFTEVEIEMSKRMFFSSCGHVYCGRCIHNIQRFRGMSLSERKQELKRFQNRRKHVDKVSASGVDFADPRFSAPLRCIAEECNKKFSGKKPFTELFL